MVGDVPLLSTVTGPWKSSRRRELPLSPTRVPCATILSRSMAPEESVVDQRGKDWGIGQE